MKNRFFSTLVILLLSMTAMSQDSYIKNRLNFKLSYQTVKTVVSTSGSDQIVAKGVQLSGNYGITNHFELGANVGYSANTEYSFKAINYSLNCNFHILPYFVKSKSFRVDAYALAEIGGIYTDVSFYLKGNSLEYGTGLGLAFYPLKHIGLFSEIKYGKYYQSDYRYNLGISLKF